VQAVHEVDPDPPLLEKRPAAQAAQSDWPVVLANWEQHNTRDKSVRCQANAATAVI
jgi:hypothetical protein